MIFKRNEGSDPGERALWGDLMSLGLTFPICIALGFFLGRWIGGRFGHAAAGQWVGLVWGIVTAFWELYKVNQRMAKRDAEELKRLKDGKDRHE
ncbi:AtpZ/AtpI family protein [Geothrix alkalitolerans]|uniref:AtpZ/AtpI family protein n=1 Tax=Geothrix alkalitolerans TaxID=2922724 RepID=UPI001FAF385B